MMRLCFVSGSTFLSNYGDRNRNTVKYCFVCILGEGKVGKAGPDSLALDVLCLMIWQSLSTKSVNVCYASLLRIRCMNQLGVMHSVEICLEDIRIFSRLCTDF